jgi:hypothetical protein
MRRFLPAVLVALLLAAGARATDIVVPLTVRPGPLSLAPSTEMTTGGQMPVTVIDARGRGTGWILLARPAGSTVGSLLVMGVESRCGRHSTCTLPTTTTRYPVILPPMRPTPVFTAKPGTGMGTIILTVKLGGPPHTAGVRLSFSLRPS